MEFHYYWIWPPVYLHFTKFCTISRKLHDIFCIVCTFMLHKFHLHIHSSFMVYKTKLMAGVLSLTHIPHLHLTPPLHLQSWIYMSTRECICLLHASCVYRYIKEKFACARILTLKISKKSVVWHLHWNNHSSRTWTLLTWPT